MGSPWADGVGTEAQSQERQPRAGPTVGLTVGGMSCNEYCHVMEATGGPTHEEQCWNGGTVRCTRRPAGPPPRKRGGIAVQPCGGLRAYLRERVVALRYSHVHEAACGPTYEKE